MCHASASRIDSNPVHASRVKAFTLVELLVVIVIVAMLASLTLAGLAGVRQRAKADKTRSTIRKIDTIIQPMYDSYATRRVPMTVPLAVLNAAQANTRTRLVATNRLQNLRLLMAIEMPDGWNDVSPTAPPLAVPSWAQNSVYRRYEAYKTSLISFPNSQFNTPVPNWPPGTTYGTLFAPAETLMMVVSMGGYEPGAMEQFRQDEIGDIDRDGAREFSDGWGRPIIFIRWPAGFVPSFPVTPQHDPLDVMRVTSDIALVPLIYSAGPDEAMNDPLGLDEGYGLRNPGPPWLASLPINSTCLGNTLGEVDLNDPVKVKAKADNITNYDLLKK